MGEAPRDTLWRAALYLRLSRDDEGAGESASIATQREILRAFAQAQGIAVAGEYTDDGWSGTRFDRPELQRMLRDIEAGRINCVLTKDLSRLGRNSARTAELLEEFFPRHAVRFLSVGEGLDSLSPAGGMDAAAPFMLLMHEFYARDLSRKIRASLQAKMRRGDFISAFAPYGYRKDPADRNRLLVDEEAAAVVRSIFRMAADGRPPRDIARELNARQIPTPAAYRRRDQAAADDGPGRAWNSSMLCKLLRNAVYLGQTEHGKTTKLSFKSPELRVKPREDWIVVPGTHEPLVSPALFEAARRRAAARRCAPGPGFVNLFSGLAVCADCGRPMTAATTRKKGSRGMLCCGGYKARGTAACSNHFLDCTLLEQVICEELRDLLVLSEAERQTVLAALAQEEAAHSRAEAGRMRRLLRKKEKRLRELDALLPQAFEQYAQGLMPEEPYRRLLAGYEKERAALVAETQSLRGRSETPRAAHSGAPSFAALLDALQPPRELTPGLLRTFIARIEVGQGRYEKDETGKKRRRQALTIVYRFAAPPDAAP